MPCALGEERGIRHLLVADRLLERDGRHLVQPRQSFRGFHGGQVSVRLGDVVLVLSAWYRWRRHARVWFQATRTQPDVRFSTWACAWSGYARHLYAVLMTRKLIRPNPDLWT
jgi:hypothetical protein